MEILVGVILFLGVLASISPFRSSSTDSPSDSKHSLFDIVSTDKEK